MTSPLIIHYYTDVLCVWAWIAQQRVDEIEKNKGEQIRLLHHCINVFGDTANRIGVKWADRGSYSGFGLHVLESASPYESAPVNPAIWRDVRPSTSANAHLYLKAAEIVANAEKSKQLASVYRRKFFVEALDISRSSVLLEIAVEMGFDEKELVSTIEDGLAIAALMADYEQALDLGLKGSPSWVLNDGRQVLYGNVGYRILNANIEEMLRTPAQEASWC